MFKVISSLFSGYFPSILGKPDKNFAFSISTWSGDIPFGIEIFFISFSSLPTWRYGPNLPFLSIIFLPSSVSPISFGSDIKSCSAAFSFESGLVNLHSGYFEQPIKAPNLPTFKLRSPPHWHFLTEFPLSSFSNINSARLSFNISRIVLVLSSFTSFTLVLNWFQNWLKTSIHFIFPEVISSKLSSNWAVKL